MKIKSTLESIFILSIIVLLFSGCRTTDYARHITFDQEISPENCATVMVSYIMTITEFNGIDVKKSWYPKNRTNHLWLTIPAGEVNLTYNMYMQTSYGQVVSWLEGKGLKFSFNFEAGKEYTIGYYSVPLKGGLFETRRQLFLAVWDRLYLNAIPEKDHESRIIKQWAVTTY